MQFGTAAGFPSSLSATWTLSSSTSSFCSRSQIRMAGPQAAHNPLHCLEGGNEISTLVFSPNRYWLCAACGPAIRIWGLEQKELVEELKVQVSEGEDGKPAAV